MGCCSNKTQCGCEAKHQGSGHWLLERFTSVALVPLTLWAIYSVVVMNGASHDLFLAWLKLPLNAGLLILTLLISFYHAALGLQVIIDDYVSTRGTNCLAVCAVRIAFVLMAVASVVSIVKIAF